MLPRCTATMSSKVCISSPRCYPAMGCSDPKTMFSCSSPLVPVRFNHIQSDLARMLITWLAELQQKLQKASVNQQRLVRLEALGNKFKLEAKAKASQRGGFTARTLRRRNDDGGASDLFLDTTS